MMLEIKDLVLKVCEERGDFWVEVVKVRFLYVYDLFVVDVIYY